MRITVYGELQLASIGGEAEVENRRHPEGPKDRLGGKAPWKKSLVNRERVGGEFLRIQPAIGVVHKSVQESETKCSFVPNPGFNSLLIRTRCQDRNDEVGNRAGASVLGALAQTSYVRSTVLSPCSSRAQ